MPKPYLLMAALYLSLAVLMALDASFINLGLHQAYPGLRWLRVHFITLGALTEFAFGVLPVVVSARAGRGRPGTRWDIWLTLNLGLLALMIGIPLLNMILITTGGTLVFVAVLLLMARLYPLRPQGDASGRQHGRWFYITGLAYLLLGILIGTGLWQGWSNWLQIKVPIEVHIHANNWGFMSLVFAGLLVDLYPAFAGRPLAWPRSVKPIFWLMSIGALFLVLGPWLGSTPVAVPGLILHLAATFWLLANVIQPLRGSALARTPGFFHLVTSYAWILAPVLVAPLIIAGVPGFPGAGIEQNAPQALIYGWVLQFAYALVPFVARRVFLPDTPPQLGGSWLSLVAVHAGAIALWVSIFQTDMQAPLQGVAYGLWFISMLPISAQLWRIVRAGMARLDAGMPLPAPEAALGAEGVE